VRETETQLTTTAGIKVTNNAIMRVKEEIRNTPILAERGILVVMGAIVANGEKREKEKWKGIETISYKKFEIKP
jgi:hypothetical protein